MQGLINKLKKIVKNQQENYEYVGTILYLLSSEEEPYKVYKLNIADNDKFQRILTYNVNKISDELNIYNYPDCTRPDYSQEISYLETNEIPMYEDIRNAIINEENTDVLRRGILESIINKSKGYVIRSIYRENNEQKEVLAYFKMTKSAFLKEEKTLFCFDRENGEVLSEVTGIQLQFDDKLVSIDIENTMFILNGNSFETLLKYQEHINMSSELALTSIGNQGIIQNFEVLREYCSSSKPMKSKLYKIYANGNIESINISDFIRVKEICGDSLMININNNNTISTQDNNTRKSVEHILRVYNDESAETIVSGTPIFADKKVLI